MRSVVTGGAGFIGSHLVEKLLDLGQEVVVIDNLSTGRLENLGENINRIQFANCDLVESTQWTDVLDNADWVFHLAALADIVPSIKQPDTYFQSNVLATFKVLQAVRKGNVGRFINVASSSCYGIPEIYPTPETAPIDPQYPYALTKSIAEQLVLHWAQVYETPALSLRLFNVYGPRSRTSGTYGAVFGVFLAQKLACQPFTVVGDGTQTRDFTYVSDIVRALIAAAKCDVTGRVYNVGSGVTTSVNRLIELLGGEKVYIPKRPGEPECTFADISRIRDEVGWRPKVSIEDGVARLLRTIDYWQEAPVWTPDSIADATADWFRYLGNNS